MIRGERFYDFDRESFAEDELDYIEARSQELAEENTDHVTGVNTVEYEDSRYMTIETKYLHAQSFAEAGAINDETSRDFEDSIELVSLRERVAAALAGTSLYGTTERAAPEKEDIEEREICASQSLFLLSGEKFTGDEVDYIWSCVQAKVDSLAPYTRFEVSQSDNYTFFKIAIESDLSTIEDNMDSLRSMIVHSVKDKDLRKKFRDSMGGISTHSGRFHTEDLGYGVSDFDGYFESLKKSN